MRLQAALDESKILREELRLPHARLERLDARKRPHYKPHDERLAILDLRAARRWLVHGFEGPAEFRPRARFRLLKHVRTQAIATSELKK
ncbi:MAG: hypothetical protein HY791_24540 [Deltaproteobacteria bacterium]|nr:hypothetical protein [Deltaproteobacteria bacterium]